MSMTTETTPIEGDVLDSMPAAHPAPAASTALVQQDNPYMRMAELALTTGKVDQLDKLWELQQKWDAEQQRKEFVSAMAAFKADPIKIVKGKLVEFTTRDGDTTSYRHATLADVVDAVVRGMGGHGLSHRWDVKQEGGQVAVTCTVIHRGGHSESVTMQAAPDASGKKNGIQQVASTVTYLQRYTLMAATGVAAADMLDDDGRVGGQEAPAETITEEQEAILRDLMDAYVTNKGKFFDWIRSASNCKHVQVISDLPANQFQNVHNQLASIRKQRSQGGSNEQ